ncbi:protein-L-isoaspartate O-methyltransferase [Bdellovibrio sp. SKB1291214]|uniref:protein-L-isoaspartate O-methyltransferase family protein n=1 Tax=Bdellovibrio sp. SKB1291214 TaxID=1732569 RepID=UPI000B515C46|nr:protein-L-isoaspartate O-methyltransferase [Bdellovibrio sp. SKB1291214]UYL09505.1 protein-L-isoaspartate O-methyltransferase [Bdellovibrio sp. SKB1291214]
MEQYQDLLLKKSLPLSEQVVEAYYRYPRHLFVPEYTIQEAYEDAPLLLFKKGTFVSTISQPSFVMRILDMLQLHPGHKVFELGAGSGWNTALMSYIVGSQGRIVSSEIIPEVADRARGILDQMRITNAKVFTGDGFEGYEQDAPYDRIIFTAGSAEMPEKIFAQLKEDGLMVFVRKEDKKNDMLQLIKKVNGQQQILNSIPCSFVTVNRNAESRLQDGTL